MLDKLEEIRANLDAYLMRQSRKRPPSLEGYIDAAEVAWLIASVDAHIAELRRLYDNGIVVQWPGDNDQSEGTC